MARHEDTSIGDISQWQSMTVPQPIISMEDTPLPTSEDRRGPGDGGMATGICNWFGDVTIVN